MAFKGSRSDLGKGDYSHKSHRPTTYKPVCDLCGSPIDTYHSASRCGIDYQKRIDAELMERKRGKS